MDIRVWSGIGPGVAEAALDLRPPDTSFEKLGIRGSVKTFKESARLPPESQQSQNTACPT